MIDNLEQSQPIEHDTVLNTSNNSSIETTIPDKF